MDINNRIRMPKKVRECIAKLINSGYSAYAVGGCIRDSILGLEPSDWDITTSARPWEIKEVFDRTVDTGIEHGTITVLMGRDSFEVTSYRIDGEYYDGRHPSSVEFTQDIKEDLARRDFTINAIAYNEEEGLIDYFGGITDINKRIIRCVGVAKERYREDALRMIRCLRFSAVLDFNIDVDTYNAIIDMSDSIEKVSIERIMVEFMKILLSDNVCKLIEISRCGLSKFFYPELDEMRGDNEYNNCGVVGLDRVDAISGKKLDAHMGNIHNNSSINIIIKALNILPPKKHIRLAILLEETLKSKPVENNATFISIDEEAEAIMRRWKLDNATIKSVKRLINCRDIKLSDDPVIIRTLMAKYGADIVDDLLDISVLNYYSGNEEEQATGKKYYDRIRIIYEGINNRNDAVSVKQLAVNGKDLIEMGLKSGPLMGVILNKLLNEVVVDPSLNDYEYLVERGRILIELEQ